MNIEVLDWFLYSNQKNLRFSCILTCNYNDIFFQGLGILPPVDVEATVMQVTTYDSKLQRDYLKFMENYLKDYQNTSSNCDFENGGRTIPVQESCQFPLELLGPCAVPANYIKEYNNVCFYLKLNKVPFNKTEFNTFELEIED